jgi:hypothetical protein
MGMEEIQGKGMGMAFSQFVEMRADQKMEPVG